MNRIGLAPISAIITVIWQSSGDRLPVEMSIMKGEKVQNQNSQD